MNITLAILSIPGYESLSPLDDFRVEDHGNGPTLNFWSNELPRPTEAQLKEGWKIYQANEYKALRRAAYSIEIPIEAQLDALMTFHETGDRTDLDELITKRAEIKQRVPKVR